MAELVFGYVKGVHDEPDYEGKWCSVEFEPPGATEPIKVWLDRNNEIGEARHDTLVESAFDGLPVVLKLEDEDDEDDEDDEKDETNKKDKKHESVITGVYFSILTQVTDIQHYHDSEGGGVKVRFYDSPWTHRVLESQDDFKHLVEELKKSLKNKSGVWVAECLDSNKIIHVACTEMTTPEEPGILIEEHFNRPESIWQVIGEWHADNLFRKIIRNEVGDMMPLSADFLRQGCTSRAHEICRMIMAEGIEPIKVWAFDQRYGMTIPTDRDPGCQVTFSWHVAAAIRTRVGLLVFDPSFFNRPVPVVQWRRKLRSRSIKLLYTGHMVYVLTEQMSFLSVDADYKNTHRYLRTLNKKYRCFVAKHGSPPYAQCQKKMSEPI